MSKQSALVDHLVSKSSMDVVFFPRTPRTVFDLGEITAVSITVRGECSKFPSVSNSRIVYATKPAPGSNKSPRGVSMPHPEYTAKLDAMTVLYRKSLNREMLEPSLLEDSANRLFVLALLGKSCSRMDSHNTTKSLCDWLQGIGLIKNDRHVDALPLHKGDHGYEGLGFDVSEIRIFRQALVRNSIDKFLNIITFTKD